MCGGCVWLGGWLAGRLVVGFGGNRAVNRRYIADFVPMDQRTKQSAVFGQCSQYAPPTRSQTHITCIQGDVSVCVCVFVCVFVCVQ